MPCLGVDYSGSEVYIAVANHNKIPHTVKLKLAGSTAAQRLLFWQNIGTTLKTLHEEFKCHDIVFIEEPWIAGNHFPKAGQMLTRTATFLEIACIYHHLEPRFVHPMTWRKAIYGTAKPQDPKGTAVGWVKENLDLEVPVMGATGRGKKPNHNFAEAAIIAIYGERMGS